MNTEGNYTPYSNSLVAQICTRHDVYVNQKYDESSGIPVPYSKHLQAVSAQAAQFMPCFNDLPTQVRIAEEKRTPNETWHLVIDEHEVQLTAWGHDLLEDTRMTYNDVKKIYGITVAKAILALQEFPGETREERHPKQYWDNILANPLAAYVKICDIIANVSWGLLFGGTMAKTYKGEWAMRQNLFRIAYPEFEPMYKKLETLFTLVL